MNDRRKAEIVLSLLGEAVTEENIEAWLGNAAGAISRLSCGCVGKCDPFAHDTAPDWDGTPSRPDWTDLSEREQCEFLKDNPYCLECGDDLTKEDIEMTRPHCKECREHPNDRCVECGAHCPEGDLVCGHCAAANRDVEDRVNGFREGE